MSKILVTGGAGFIGSHIVEVLLINDYQVVVLDDLSTGSLENLPIHNNLIFYKCDLARDPLEEIFKKENPNFIIHLAAQVSVGNSIADPFTDASTNILGSIRLIELSKKYNVEKFIAASSAAVYGIPKYLPIDEGHPTEPISQYGLSKITMERYIILSGIPYMIFRFSNVYGPRQKSSKESGVIAIFDAAMRKDKVINVFGDGGQIRDFIYVEDIANICLEAIRSDITNDVFNVSTNTGITINELVAIMSDIYSYNKKVNYLVARNGEIRESVLLNTKIINSFKFRHDTFLSLQLGIKKMRQSNV